MEKGKGREQQRQEKARYSNLSPTHRPKQKTARMCKNKLTETKNLLYSGAKNFFLQTQMLLLELLLELLLLLLLLLLPLLQPPKTVVKTKAAGEAAAVAAAPAAAPAAASVSEDKISWTLNMITFLFLSIYFCTWV